VAHSSPPSSLSLLPAPEFLYGDQRLKNIEEPQSMDQSVVDKTLKAIQSVVRAPAPLHAPEINGNEWNYVKECLDTGWVSTAGSFVERFEDALCEITGSSFAVATVTGTAALHAALLVAGVKDGDEVIVPSLSFVATANAVTYCHAVPHFADIEEATLGLDPKKLDTYLSGIVQHSDGAVLNRQSGRPISAIVCMHTFGHPCDLDGLLEVAGRHGVPLIEDAAESLGSTYNGRHAGTFGLVSALSFNGNKIATCGGGGAILTNDKALARHAKHLTTTAKVTDPFGYDHDEVGFNYRLANINAALGVAQLEKLAANVEKKRALADLYAGHFADVSGVDFFAEPKGAHSNYWLNTLVFDDADCIKAVLEAAADQGISCRRAWTPLHRLDPFRDCPKSDLGVTEGVTPRLMNIPSSPNLAPS
jgi:perosamine synthetase